jgi:transketolase
MNRTPGIDFTTGSLGQGTSAAAGIALADRMKRIPSFTYLVIGDGESQEGQVWEAAMFANHYHLGNLIAFHDYNKLQIDGTTVDVMGIDDVNTKWHGFGWHVQRVNGHDVTQLYDAVQRARKIQDRPSVIICDTIKAKGFPPGEGKASSHNMHFTYEQAQEAIAALDAE